MQTHTDSRQDARLTIRILGERDRDAIRRLAERDGTAPPATGLLGAELGGRLVAAVAVADAEAPALADPFVPTAELVRMLRMRTAQLRAEGRPRRRWLRLPARRGAGSRGALAGSPPGGGGRLLEL